MSRNPSENPSEKPRVTLRDIAKQLGVSHVTVSKALRNQSGASAELKARIRQKADEMGYTPDPMLSALSHYRKTSKEKPVQSALAWINTWSNPKELRNHREFDLYWEGAKASAKRFGYHLEEFNLAEIPMRRLEGILKSRNIQGILMPSVGLHFSKELEQFDWSSFATVRFGLTVPFPPTHFVTSAQMMNTMHSIERVHQLGYQRIGFVCEYWEKRFFGVGYSWAQKKLPKEQQLPPLLMNANDNLDQEQCALEIWLRYNKPDAIITDKSEVPLMLQNLGYRIPEDIGVATTSIHDTPINAGIDQRPEEIGRAAIRILTALIAERSFGLPDCLNETLVEGNWVDGSMLPGRFEK
ncbi:LacI family DNA-binding transcriptional regulator [Pontiellaceae bacterium B1224]|nr:LacI family DNA-binding transcriptional regulator [Pontiellaceae bacterium B1224]